MSPACQDFRGCKEHFRGLGRHRESTTSSPQHADQQMTNFHKVPNRDPGSSMKCYRGAEKCRSPQEGDFSKSRDRASTSNNPGVYAKIVGLASRRYLSSFQTHPSYCTPCRATPDRNENTQETHILKMTSSSSSPVLHSIRSGSCTYTHKAPPHRHI